jgi:hypothetical protein
MKIFTSFLILSFFLIAEATAQGLANGRPADFPIPHKNETFLFFIQRNKNKNTIVYDANLDEDGNLERSEPIDAYWRRRNSGKRDELKWIEQKFAYGYNSKPDGNGGFWIELTAYDERQIHLQKDKKGQPVATIKINGKECFLDFLWVFADESGTWPTVIHVDIHGREVATGKAQVERIVND